MSIHRTLPTLALLATLGCAASSGGRLPIPEEPLDVPGFENPSSLDYFRYGEEILESRPETAAEAFYWAYRRDPTWATPLFGRRLALFLTDYYLYGGYLSRDRRVMRRPEVAQLDSLYLRALTLNPFLDRRLDAMGLRAYWKGAVRQAYQRSYPGSYLSDAQLSIAMQQAMLDADDEFKAWLAHSEGRYAEAVTYYAQAIEDTDEAAELHADMARALFMLGRYTEAVEHMEAAVAELRDRDEDELQRLYSSKALYLQTVGLIQEQQGHDEAARQAYASALQEDLSYHPAHVRLAELALAAGDTATALNEMRLAADIGPDEPTVLLSYGRLLEATGDLAGAEAAYRHLTEIEPYFAEPFGRLAGVLEAEEQPAEAVGAYRAFLDQASADEAGLDEARERLSQLLRAMPELQEPAESPAGGRR